MNLPIWKKILAFLIFQYDWKIKVKLDPEEFKHLLRKKFNANKAVGYRFQYRSFSFLHSQFTSSVYGSPVSMVGHIGRIKAIDEANSEIIFSCRFLFLANIYLLICPGFLIGAYLGYIPLISSLLIVTGVYLFASVLYLIDIYEAKKLIHQYLEEFIE